jgi:hypothetical protein
MVNEMICGLLKKRLVKLHRLSQKAEDFPV